MELVGDVAEEKGLTGDEGLVELLNDFTEEKAVLAVELLPGMAGHFEEVVAKKQAKIKEVIQNLANEVPLSSQVKDVGCALESLAVEYICAEMGPKYDRISPQLFGLRRKVVHKRKDSYGDEEETDIILPLFADVSFGGSIWKLGKVCDIDGKEYKVDISARAPPITRDVKEKAKQVKVDYMEICSKALREQLVGDILLRNISSVAGLDLRTYWIPSPSELNIEMERIDKDPILVANLYNRHYLVSTWDVQGEEPFEHYVREFTEEKARS